MCWLLLVLALIPSLITFTHRTIAPQSAVTFAWFRGDSVDPWSSAWAPCSSAVPRLSPGPNRVFEAGTGDDLYAPICSNPYSPLLQTLNGTLLLLFWLVPLLGWLLLASRCWPSGQTLHAELAKSAVIASLPAVAAACGGYLLWDPEIRLPGPRLVSPRASAGASLFATVGLAVLWFRLHLQRRGQGWFDALCSG